MGVDGQYHALAVLPRDGAQVLIVQVAGCTPGPVWTDVEKRRSVASEG
jgi:hypothetical protein